MNPKDRIGLTKTPLRLLPPAPLAAVAKVMELGAAKYGAWNWRDEKVHHSVYLEAALRHIFQALDGEIADEESGMPHESHAAACMLIVLDAMANDSLIHDIKAVVGPGTFTETMKRVNAVRPKVKEGTPTGA